MAVKLAMARSPASVTRTGPSRCFAGIPRRAISIEPVTKSGPLPRNQLIRTTESGQKHSRICSQRPISRLSRSRKISCEIEVMSALSSTAFGKLSFMGAVPRRESTVAKFASFGRKNSLHHHVLETAILDDSLTLRLCSRLDERT